MTTIARCRGSEPIAASITCRAVHARQTEVGDDHVEGKTIERLERGLAIGGLGDLEAFVRKSFSHNTSERFLIVDEEADGAMGSSKLLTRRSAVKDCQGGTLSKCTANLKRLAPIQPVEATPVERQTVSIMKACEMVGVSRRTIYNWIAANKVEYLRTAGGSIRIFVDTLWREPDGTKHPIESHRGVAGSQAVRSSGRHDDRLERAAAQAQ